MANSLPLFDQLPSPARGSRTLADQAYSVLHEAIISGQLAPGSRLPIEELAKALGMSPMPIREALRRLDGVGLVELVPHRGATVTELSIEDLVSVYEARLSLEPLATQHAAQRIGPSGAREAEAALAAMQDASSQTAEIWAAHSDFHFALYKAAGSRWLIRLITPLWQSSERYRKSVGETAQLRPDEHEAILDAVLSGDSPRAATLMHNHLSITANSLARLIAGPDVFELTPVPNSHPVGIGAQPPKS